MLNLLAFKPGMKGEYLKYGKAFGERVGRRYGGVAKIVGNVVVSLPSSPPPAAAGEQVETIHDATTDTWDEIALAHYPSISHFASMLQDEEYQAVNHQHRLPSLRDTCILMTSEIGVEEMMKGVGSGSGAKL
jgi:hypothetical protein